jgi:SAM-dependent methyltransferase
VGALLRGIDAVNRAHPWSHNDHYARWILRQLPPGARTALDVGCGTGNLLRALDTRIPQVDGLDRDPAMAAAAGARVADLLDLPAEPAYDVVTSVAVLHHLPLRPALTRLRELVRPGGRLLVVGCYRQATVADRAGDLLAVPANLLLGLVKSAGADVARRAMSAPAAPPAETLAEIRAAAAEVLPGAAVRRRLFWRYTLRWTRVSAAPAPG